MQPEMPPQNAEMQNTLLYKDILQSKKFLLGVLLLLIVLFVMGVFVIAAGNSSLPANNTNQTSDRNIDSPVSSTVINNTQTTPQEDQKNEQMPVANATKKLDFKLSGYPFNMSPTSYLAFDIEVDVNATFAVTALRKMDTAPEGVTVVEPNADIFSEYFINSEDYSLYFTMVSEVYPQTVNAVRVIENTHLKGQIQNPDVTVALAKNSNKYLFMDSANYKTETCGTVGSGEEVEAPCGLAILSFGVGDSSYSYIISCDAKTNSGLNECVEAVKTLKVNYQG